MLAIDSQLIEVLFVITASGGKSLMRENLGSYGKHSNTLFLECFSNEEYLRYFKIMPEK